MNGAIWFYGLAVATLIGLGGWLEHLLRPKPKMTTDDFLTACELIDVECEGNYDQVRALRDELSRWLNNPKAKKSGLSSELRTIIDRACCVNNNNDFL